MAEDCQAAASKTEAEHADNFNDAHCREKASQTTEDNKSSDNLNQVTRNDISRASTRQNAKHTCSLTKNGLANEAASMLY